MTPGWWDAKGVRGHFLDRASKCGAGTAGKADHGFARAFLRYLQCPRPVPEPISIWLCQSLPSWRFGQTAKIFDGGAGRQPDRRM